MPSAGDGRRWVPKAIAFGRGSILAGDGRHQVPKALAFGRGSILAGDGRHRVPKVPLVGAAYRPGMVGTRYQRL